MSSKLSLIVMWLFAAHLADANYNPGRSCPTHYHFIAGQCFRFHQHTVTWLRAHDECEKEGATLASVTTDEKYDGLLGHIESNYGGQYWLSGALVGGVWLWTNEGRTMEYKWFGENPVESGEMCAYICSVSKKYWDEDCLMNLKFICEKRNDCTTHYPGIKKMKL